MSNDDVLSNTSPGALDIDDAADAFVNQWEDAETPSEAENEASVETAEETSEETEELLDEEDTESPEDSEEDPGEESDTDTEEAEEEVELSLDDDTLVELTVDGETKQASIKDLKRLYGQEASLTQKSQQLATQRKQADENLNRASAQMQRMLERAQERYQPYSEVDMLVASRQMNAAEFAQLRKEAKDAESDLKFLNEEADTFYANLKTQHVAQQQTAAKECVKVLQEHLPDWSDSLYNDIRTYAVSTGLPEDAVNSFTDPNVIMLLNKARLYDQGKKVATTKKSKAPTRVLRSKKAPQSSTDKRSAKVKAAADKLQANPVQGNDFDSLADLIVAGWEN